MLAYLKLIVQVIIALPSIISAFRQLQNELKKIQHDKKEASRREDMNQVAEKLKEAQNTGDTNAQDELLNSIVDDYNR